MAARARGGQSPMELAPPRLPHALTPGNLPVGGTLRALLDSPSLVIVGGVVGTALASELALRPAQRLGVGRHLRAEGPEKRSLLPDHGEGARTKSEPHHASAQDVLRLARGGPCTDQLREEAVPHARR